MDFIALDIETANADMSSVCAIGLVHFRDGQVYRDLSSLIDPEEYFDEVNISVHGIRPEDVIGKPTIRKLYPALVTNLEHCVVVHHTQFDRTALRQIAVKLGQPEIACNWLDSAKLARQAWERFSRSGFGLANLATEFNIEFQHHDAREDARCCGLVALRAVDDTGIPIEEWCEILNEASSASNSTKHPPRVKIDGNQNGHLFGEVAVFTGSLTIERSAAAALAAAAGCEVCPGVTKRTTLLVVGDQDIRLLNGHQRSSKHRKAEKLITDGQAIRIVRESDFMELIAPR